MKTFFIDLPRLCGADFFWNKIEAHINLKLEDTQTFAAKPLS